MPKPSYFALVGIETLTLQELLACQARQNGLSPTDWTNPLEPEPPPSSSPSPLLNSDTTKLTLVESSAAQASTPQGILTDTNLSGPSVFEQAHKPFTNGTLSPLSSWVDTSRRVATPLKNNAEPARPKHACLSSQLCKTICTSLERGNKYSPSRAVKIISTWLYWLLYSLDVDSTNLLNWVVHDFRRGSVHYKLDPALAHAIWQCRVILGEVVQEISSSHETTASDDYRPRPCDLEKSNLTARFPTLNRLQLTVSQARHHLWDASNILASYPKGPTLARRNHAAIKGIYSPLGISQDIDFGLTRLVAKEVQVARLSEKGDPVATMLGVPASSTTELSPSECSKDETTNFILTLTMIGTELSSVEKYHHSALRDSVQGSSSNHKMTSQDCPRSDSGNIRFPTSHKDVFQRNNYQHASKPINDILESNPSELSDSSRTLKSKWIERSSQPEHSIATTSMGEARKGEHTLRNGSPNVPICTDGQEMRGGGLTKIQLSSTIARNRYEDELQVTLFTSFITLSSLWLIESMVIPHNATSSNPTRDNCGKRGCGLPQRVALVRDKAYHCQIGYTVNLLDSKTADTGCNFSMIRARKPWDSTPKLELNEDELVKMFVSGKLGLMARSTQVEGGNAPGAWSPAYGLYECSRPERGIEDSETDDESQDPQPSVTLHRRFLDAYFTTVMEYHITHRAHGPLNIFMSGFSKLITWELVDAFNQNVPRADLFQGSVSLILNRTTQEPEAQRSVLSSLRNAETPASNPGHGLGQESTTKRTAFIRENSFKRMTYTPVYGEDTIPAECKWETSTWPDSSIRTEHVSYKCWDIRTLQNVALLVVNLLSGPHSYIAKHPHGNANLGEFNLSPDPYSPIARRTHGDGHTHTYHFLDPQTRLHLPWEALRPILSLTEGSRMPKGNEPFKLYEIRKTPLPASDSVQIKGLPEPHGGTNATNEVVEASTELLRAASAKGGRYRKPVVRNVWVSCLYCQTVASCVYPQYGLKSKVTGPVGAADIASSATFKLPESPQNNEIGPIRTPTTYRVGVTIILENGIPESKLNELSNSSRTTKPEWIKRFLQPERSMMTMSIAVARENKYMSRDGSLNSSFITSKEEERDYGLPLRVTPVLPSSHNLQAPIRIDSQDTTGGGPPRSYETGSKWKFKTGDLSQDNGYDTEPTDQSSKVSSPSLRHTKGQLNVIMVGARKCCRDEHQDVMPMGLSEFKTVPQGSHQWVERDYAPLSSSRMKHTVTSTSVLIIKNGFGPTRRVLVTEPYKYSRSRAKPIRRTVLESRIKFIRGRLSLTIVCQRFLDTSLTTWMKWLQPNSSLVILIHPPLRKIRKNMLTPPLSILRCRVQVPNGFKIELLIGDMSDINIEDWTKFADYWEYEMNKVHQWSWWVNQTRPIEYKPWLLQLATGALRIFAIKNLDRSSKITLEPMPHNLQLLVLDRTCVKGLPELHRRFQTEIPSYLYGTVSIRNEEREDVLVQNLLWQSPPDYGTMSWCYLQPKTDDTDVLDGTQRDAVLGHLDDMTVNSGHKASPIEIRQSYDGDPGPEWFSHQLNVDLEDDIGEDGPIYVNSSEGLSPKILSRNVANPGRHEQRLPMPSLCTNAYEVLRSGEIMGSEYDIPGSGRVNPTLQGPYHVPALSEYLYQLQPNNGKGVGTCNHIIYTHDSCPEIDPVIVQPSIPAKPKGYHHKAKPRTIKMTDPCLDVHQSRLNRLPNGLSATEPTTTIGFRRACCRTPTVVVIKGEEPSCQVSWPAERHRRSHGRDRYQQGALLIPGESRRNTKRLSKPTSKVTWGTIFLPKLSLLPILCNRLTVVVQAPSRAQGICERDKNMRSPYPNDHGNGPFTTGLSKKDPVIAWSTRINRKGAPDRINGPHIHAYECLHESQLPRAVGNLPEGPGRTMILESLQKSSSGYEMRRLSSLRPDTDVTKLPQFHKSSITTVEESSGRGEWRLVHEPYPTACTTSQTSLPSRKESKWMGSVPRGLRHDQMAVARPSLWSFRMDYALMPTRG
ncbi:hypothetical protein BS47DRAFT_1416609 [Hydnum rufescens UP504]|uniref:Uncharacterized protein n=1 Tax=Hydnum rufescens UP504 TaxID=1448309 RepID=A0A9P6DRG9_9AGAM|nr:hypothetical protein BS47DRAFT_1416609 [Hydnum rufescens UP504]